MAYLLTDFEPLQSAFVFCPCLKVMPTTLPPSTLKVSVMPSNASGRNVVLSRRHQGVAGSRANPSENNFPSLSVKCDLRHRSSPLYLPAYDL